MLVRDPPSNQDQEVPSMELMLILNLLKLSVTKASSYKILTSYVCTGLVG